jgi:prevent-host-death family protein
MVSVNIAKLKAELSKYIKIAESGEEVIITDHSVPKVKLVVVEEGPRPKLVIRKATNPHLDFSTLIRPDPIPGLDVVALLREDRDAR